MEKPGSLTTEPRANLRPTPELLALVEKAARAPSSHNTQPWLFETASDRVMLYADRTRALPVNDPYDRELVISCGAALLNLEVAAARAGYDIVTELLPNPEDEDHLATVTLGAKSAGAQRASDPPRVDLAAQIDRRWTTRGPFEKRPISLDLEREFVDLAFRHGVRFLSISEHARREQIAALVAEGDQAQFADPRWRRELASWMHPRRTGDGLPVPEVVAPIGRLFVSRFDLGKSTGRKDHELVMSAPLLGVLVSDRDSDRAWLESGRALEAILLRAAGDGVQAGYLNQPCQVAELRPRLQDILGGRGFPQLVVRLGHGAEHKQPSPRRPVEQLLLH